MLRTLIFAICFYFICDMDTVLLLQFDLRLPQYCKFHIKTEIERDRKRRGQWMGMQWHCNKKEKFQVNNMPKIRKRKREKMIVRTGRKTNKWKILRRQYNTQAQCEVIDWGKGGHTITIYYKPRALVFCSPRIYYTLLHCLSHVFTLFRFFTPYGALHLFAIVFFRCMHACRSRLQYVWVCVHIRM